MPKRTILAVGVVGIIPFALGADAAADLEAGFGARNKEVAGAIGVANANILKRFRLGSHR